MTIDVDNIVLEQGSHQGEDGGCVMEWVALLAGQKKTDQPTCTNLVITLHAQRLNDRLPPSDRQRLKVFIPRLLRAKRTTKDRRVNVRLAIWAARDVLHLVHPDVRPAAEAAIASAEGWLAGTVTENECWEARRVLLDVRRKWWATTAAAAATTAATTTDATTATTAAATATATATTDERSWIDAQIDFFDRLLDAHEKALAEEGVLWESEFCSFAEAL